ncbi:MAG: hypothetical protein P8Y75_09705 [Nitrospirota bacterium]|jgi:hypothetical protein
MINLSFDGRSFEQHEREVPMYELAKMAIKVIAGILLSLAIFILLPPGMGFVNIPIALSIPCILISVINPHKHIQFAIIFSSLMVIINLLGFAIVINSMGGRFIDALSRVNLYGVFFEYILYFASALFGSIVGNEIRRSMKVDRSASENFHAR